MVFRKLMHAFGGGGPSVDTVLDTGDCVPGGVLRGRVHLQGGDRTVEIEHITLSLVARVEFEGGEHEHAGGMEFFRVPVTDRFTLGENRQETVPFEFPVPWETPVTTVFGQPLHGMAVGVKTEVSVARAVDPGDLDPLVVRPLPAQEVFLDGIGRLGFTFEHADLEYGQLRGINQQLPFYQEIEFYAPPAYGGRITELEVTFVASPCGMDVVLEADKRGGLFGGSHDTFHHLRVDYGSAPHTDWAAQVDGWLQQLLAGAPSLGYGAIGHGYDNHGYGGHHGHRTHRHGPGMGAVAGGAAAGLVGGMVAGELIDEAGDAFFDDED